MLVLELVHCYASVSAMLVLELVLCYAVTVICNGTKGSHTLKGRTYIKYVRQQIGNILVAAYHSCARRCITNSNFSFPFILVLVLTGSWRHILTSFQFLFKEFSSQEST